MAKKVLVIRVGSKTTHIVHMDNIDDEPAIYGCMRVTTPEGCVSDGQILDVTNLARMITKTMKDKRINCKDAIFVIPSSKIASREATVPAVGKQRIDGLIEAKINDLFPVDTSQYVFSHIIQGEPYSGGQATIQEDSSTDLEAAEGDGKKGKFKLGKKKDEVSYGLGGQELVQDALIFAAPQELIQSYYTLADAMGVRVAALEADGNSVFQIMKRQVGRGTMLSVQMNRDSTLVNVVNQDKLLLQRVVPYGINVFTDMIQGERAFKCEDFDKAFKLISSQRVLLPRIGVENPSEDYSMEKRINVTDAGEHLIGNISRVVEFYNSQHKDEPIQSISLTGWGCSIVGIHELMSNELGIETSTPKEILGIRFNRKVEMSASMLQYINCFGGVFRPVNFVSKIESEKSQNKGSMVGPVLIFGLLFLLAAVVSVWSYLSLIIATDERDQMQQRYNALSSVQSEYNELQRIENNYGLYKQVVNATDLNNNHFRTDRGGMSDKLQHFIDTVGWL